MKIAAKLTKKGFTLVEVLTVMAIVMMLIATMGSGLVYMQNSVKLDNAIRDIKSEIQNTQNNARNSFISGKLADNKLENNRISVGWLFTLKNSGNNLDMEKRSIYFIPGTGYNYLALRTDIQTFLTSQNLNLSCNSQNQLTSNVGTIKFPTSTNILMCSTENQEYIFPTTTSNPDLRKNGMNMTLSKEGATNCSQSSQSVNLFFTAGYGEPVFADTNGCQIQIRNTNSVLTNFRSLAIDKSTGYVATCANFCNPIIKGVSEEIIVITPNPTSIQITPTSAPSPTPFPTKCFNCITIEPLPTDPAL